MRKFLRELPAEFETPAGHRFRIITHFCKGCRICVEFCPTDCLDLDERFKVKVVHPEKCIGCRQCEFLCPDLAIYVTKAEVHHKDPTSTKGKAEKSDHKDTKGTKGRAVSGKR